MEINFLACFRTHIVCRVPLSLISRLLVERHRLILTSSSLSLAPFLRLTYGALLLRVCNYRYPLHSSECVSETQRDLKCIIANWDTMNILLGEYGQDTWQTWWLTILLDATWHQLSTLESKKLLQTLWIVYVIIIYIRDVYVYFRN